MLQRFQTLLSKEAHRRLSHGGRISFSEHKFLVGDFIVSGFVVPPNIRQLVRTLFWALACLTAAIGLWLIVVIVMDARTINVYERDFYQDWLLARALSVGGDPFLSLSEMAQRYGGTEWHWQFVSPHPLTLGLLVMPLSWLPYPTAALGWLSISISSYFAALALLQKSLRFASLLLLGLALIVWFPVHYDWLVGNTSSVLLLCLVGALLAFKAKHPSLVGVSVGIALLIKPICWPVALLLLVRGQWRAVLSAGATLAVGYALVALFFGPELIIRYITEVLPNASTFSNDPHSISIWDVAPR